MRALRLEHLPSWLRTKPLAGQTLARPTQVPSLLQMRQHAAPKQEPRPRQRFPQMSPPLSQRGNRLPAILMIPQTASGCVAYGLRLSKWCWEIGFEGRGAARHACNHFVGVLCPCRARATCTGKHTGSWARGETRGAVVTVGEPCVSACSPQARSSHSVSQSDLRGCQLRCVCVCVCVSPEGASWLPSHEDRVNPELPRPGIRGAAGPHPFRRTRCLRHRVPWPRN